MTPDHEKALAEAYRRIDELERVVAELCDAAGLAFYPPAAAATCGIDFVPFGLPASSFITSAKCTLPAGHLGGHKWTAHFTPSGPPTTLDSAPATPSAATRLKAFDDTMRPDVAALLEPLRAPVATHPRHKFIDEPDPPATPSAAPCGGSRCHQAADGTWIHSSKSYGTCSVRNAPSAAAGVDDTCPESSTVHRTEAGWHDGTETCGTCGQEVRIRDDGMVAKHRRAPPLPKRKAAR